MRALVTGGNGFVAQWSMRAMLERGWSVTAAGIGALPERQVLSASDSAKVKWETMDITRQAEVASVVERARPDVVLHLAAVSHVPDATNDPGYAYEVNAVGTVRLLSEVQRLRTAGTADPLVLVVGSSDQYGRHERDEMPLTEEAEQRPLSPYAASKVAQETAALQSFRSEGVRVVCTRSFSHSGVGHAPHFLLPGLVARAMALPPRGGRLLIGNGETVRDFLHVHDVVVAYLDLAERGTPGEAYNVCSGDGVSVRELAMAVLKRLDRSAEIVSDPSLKRAVDVHVLVGDNSKLRRATGWAPNRTRDDIIDDLINAATH